MNKIKIRNLLIKNSRLLVLIALFIFFSLTTSNFWNIHNWTNVRNIILQQAPFTILLSISMTLVIILRGFDLAIGASIALISCICAMVLHATYNVFLGIGVALGLGLLIGFAEGMLVGVVGVSVFIVTFSMKYILRGLSYVLLGGRQIYDMGPKFRPIFISSPYTFLILAAIVAVIVSFILGWTNFGREIYAVGINQEAAKMSGIRVKRVYVLTFIICGLITAFTAVLYIANLGTAEPVIGEDFAMTAIAASLVGGTSVTGGAGKVSNAVIGSFTMLIINNGMIHLGVPTDWQDVVIGIIILFSITSERFLQKFTVDTE